jgi:O-antigen ligase
MITPLPIKTKLSRPHIEFLVTVVTAFFLVQIYNSSPVLITGVILCSVFAGSFLLKKPEYSILFIAAILPFRDIQIVSILYLRSAIIWTLLAYTLWRYSISSQKFSSYNLRFFNKIAFVFFLALVVSLIRMVPELHSTTLITRTMIKAAVVYYAPIIIEGFLLLYIVYYSMHTLQQMQRLVDVTLIVSAIIAFLGIWQYFIGGNPLVIEALFDPEFRFSGRATSVFSNPNDLGSFSAIMVTLALVSFVWGTSSKKKKIFFNLPIFFLNGLALVLSFSRGGMIQFFLSMSVAMYLYYMKICKTRLTWKVILLMIVILTTIGLAISFYDLYMRARIASHSETEYQKALYYTQTRSDSLRKLVAIRAFQSVLTHPLLGVGFNMFSGKGLAGVSHFGLATHNQFLKILAEMGLFGFIPFIILLAIVIKSGMTIWRKSGNRQIKREVQLMMLLLLSGISSVVFGYLFMDSLVAISATGYLWIFSGAIFVLDRQYNNKEERAHSS